MRKIDSNFAGKHLISLNQFERKDIELVFEKTKQLKLNYINKRNLNLLEGTTVSLLFFEPSSRTFSSFSSAVKKLGGVTIEFQNMMETSSTTKGETIEDTVNVFENYSDAIIMRHPEVGSLQRAASASKNTPLINAGDGSGEHPSQALMDMFSIYEKHGSLDGIKGLFVGDLLFGRTVHSLLKGFANFKDVTLYLLSPNSLKTPSDLVAEIREKGVNVVEIESENDIPNDCKFWYWTRVQKERFDDINEYEKVKNTFILSSELIKKKASADTIFMHPLPRVGEILTEVDADKRSIYLTDQIKNGLYVRMTIISLILGKL